MSDESKRGPSISMRGLWPLYALAVLIIATVAGRVFSDKLQRGIDETALFLLILAAITVLLPLVLTLLPDLRKVKVGDVEFEFGRLEKELPEVSGEELDAISSSLPADEDFGEAGWSEEGGVYAEPDPTFDPALAHERETRKKQARDIFLAHVLRPSKKPGQKYDVFLFLVRSDAPDLTEVAYAEFYFGRYWRHRVFKVFNRERYVGVKTAAYGQFLAVCRITFRNGEKAIIDRFVDFEMGRLFPR